MPAVGRPGAADKATHGDDGVSQVKEGVDDTGPAFVASREPAEGVLPGVRALYVPALGGLDRGLFALVRDPAFQPALVEDGTGLAQVVARVQVHGDVVGQRAEVVQQVQGGDKQGRVVAVRSGQYAAE